MPSMVNIWIVMLPFQKWKQNNNKSNKPNKKKNLQEQQQQKKHQQEITFQCVFFA